MEVDAKDERAASFYRKIEFSALNDNTRHLFIMRTKLAEFIQSQSGDK